MTAPSPWESLDDDALFGEVLAMRSADRSAKAGSPRRNAELGLRLGELLSRWRRPGLYVIRRVLASYRRDAAADHEELLQDAIAKLLERGLDQYRGSAAEGAADEPPRAGAARTFFLRIVKHTAIDHCRKKREELAAPSPTGDEPEHAGPEIGVAMDRARREADRDEAVEVYWRAFERLRVEHPSEAEAWDLYHHQEIGDHDVCAERLGISVVNSYKRVSRAQAHLKLFLLETRD